MKRQYVLLTAAKDEEAYIEEVLKSVLRQTVLPLAWFIVDDGSSDRTAEIVERITADHSFVHLQSAGSRGGRNFGSQYKAVMAAYGMAKSLEFDFVGVLDADSALKRNDYYESILQEFERNPRLGIAGGVIYERPRGVWEPAPEYSGDSVAASAFFRRGCFDQIGGYTPLFYGGSDWLIQLDARRAGWETMTCADQPILHYRPTWSAGRIWRRTFQNGLMDASFGSDPVFELLKCGRRITARPILFGSFVRLCGYLWWGLTARKPLIEPGRVAFLKREQRAKMRRWIKSFELGRSSN
jgi:glycosyltransferase involved in cell wall biosynthesis